MQICRARRNNFEARKGGWSVPGAPPEDLVNATKVLQGYGRFCFLTESARLYRSLWGTQRGCVFLPGDEAFIGSKLACQAHLMFAEGDRAVEASETDGQRVANLNMCEV